MAGYFGWWDYESSPPALVNRYTGQRVTSHQFAGAPQLPKYALGFLYSDGDLEFPLVVRTSLQGHGPDHGKPFLQSTWELDYDLSVDAWHAIAKPTDLFPPYDIWVRMDECVMDALGCWPEHDRRISTHILKSRSGWLGGQWLSKLQREHPALARAEQNRHEIVAAYPDGHVLPIGSDTIDSLNWHFVDAEITSARATLDGLDSTRGFPYLPATPPLSGFEGVPHLRRDDGAAVYFPSEITTHFHRGEDLYLYARFIYADEYAVLTLNESDYWMSASFMPRLCDVRLSEEAERYAPLPPSLIHSHLRPMLFPYWRRACRVLTQMRFLWQGPERRMPVSEERWAAKQKIYHREVWPAPQFKLRPLSRFGLTGGFIAGVPSPHWSVKVLPQG